MISFDLEGVNCIYLEGIKPAILSLAIFRKLAFRGSSVLESEPFQMRSLMFIDKAKVKRSSCLIDLIMYGNVLSSIDLKTKFMDLMAKSYSTYGYA